jgi:hypothetical protein
MTLVNTEIADKYQKFFNFMNQEHGLILRMEEMDEIVFEAQRLVKEFDSIPSVVEQSEQLPQNFCTLNIETCGKGSGCKYPHCHL